MPEVKNIANKQCENNVVKHNLTAKHTYIYNQIEY